MTATTSSMIPTMILASISWCAGQISRLQTRIRELQAEEDKAVALRLSTRSGDWIIERRIAIVKLAKGLKKNPDLVALQLELTAEGCDWLINRWSDLASVFDDEDGTDWTDDERAGAFNLLGIPQDLRKRNTLLGPEGHEGIPEREMICERRIEQLEARLIQGGLRHRSDQEYRAEVAGIFRTPDAHVTRIRREIAAAERSLRFAIKENAQAVKSEEAEKSETKLDNHSASKTVHDDPAEEEEETLPGSLTSLEPTAQRHPMPTPQPQRLGNPAMFPLDANGQPISQAPGSLACLPALARE